MAVNKNFVVRNGLEVNTNLIFAETNSNKVGIATTVVDYTLDVGGGLRSKSSNITGISTVNDLVVQGTLNVNASTGSTGNYLVSTGSGVAWISPRVSTVFTATVGQTTFNVNYTIGLVDVYVNGIRLVPSEFTASTGTSVTLNDACFGDETVECVVYSSL
jgi:hypothetical protein